MADGGVKKVAGAPVGPAALREFAPKPQPGSSAAEREATSVPKWQPPAGGTRRTVDARLFTQNQIAEALRSADVPPANHPFTKYVNDLRQRLAARGLPTSAEGVRVFVVGEQRDGDTTLSEHAEEVLQTLGGPLGLAQGATLNVLRSAPDRAALSRVAVGEVRVGRLGHECANFLVAEYARRRNELNDVLKRAPADGHTTFISMSNGMPAAKVASSFATAMTNLPAGSPLRVELAELLRREPTANDEGLLAEFVLRAFHDALEGPNFDRLARAHQALARDVASARQRGVMIFKSAGNGRVEGESQVDERALELNSGMVLVGAIDLGKNPLDPVDDEVASFSVEGAVLGAVGVNMPFKGRDVSGTSFSTPFAVSVAALMTKANPRITPTQIERILKETSVPVRGGLNEIDVVAAVARAKASAR